MLRNNSRTNLWGSSEGRRSLITSPALLNISSDSWQSFNFFALCHLPWELVLTRSVSIAWTPKYSDGLYCSLSETKSSIVVWLPNIRYIETIVSGRPSSIVKIYLNSVMYNTMYRSETCKWWFFAPLIQHAYFNEQGSLNLLTLSLTYWIDQSLTPSINLQINLSHTHVVTHLINLIIIYLLTHSASRSLTSSLTKIFIYSQNAPTLSLIHSSSYSFIQ